MFDDEDENESFLKLRKHHQELADELGMTAEEYLDYRQKIDSIEEERIRNETPMIHTKVIRSINLIDNIEDYGYSKQFLSRDDAEFLFDKIKQWDDDTSYMIGIDEEETIDRDEIVSTYVATGVKYDFKNYDISIYCVFSFDKYIYADCDPCLNYFHQMYLYNHRTKEFVDIKEHDYTKLAF